MAIDFTAASSQYVGYGTGGGVGASNDWTVACWVYSESTTDAMYVAKRDSYASGENQFSIGTGDGANNVTISANNTNRRSSEVQVPTNEWALVAGGSDGSTCFTYCNGTIKENYTGPAFLRSGTSTDQVLQVGAQDATPSTFMDGGLAEIGIWNVRLTTAELDALYDGVSVPFIRPNALQHYMPLYNTSNANDIIGSLTGTVNASPTDLAHPRIIYPHKGSF